MRDTLNAQSLNALKAHLEIKQQSCLCCLAYLHTAFLTGALQRSLLCRAAAAAQRLGELGRQRQPGESAGGRAQLHTLLLRAPHRLLSKLEAVVIHAKIVL